MSLTDACPLCDVTVIPIGKCVACGRISVVYWVLTSLIAVPASATAVIGIRSSWHFGVNAFALSLCAPC